jgi:hypothetical protein
MMKTERDVVRRRRGQPAHDAAVARLHAERRRTHARHAAEVAVLTQQAADAARHVVALEAALRLERRAAADAAATVARLETQVCEDVVEGASEE